MRYSRHRLSSACKPTEWPINVLSKRAPWQLNGANTPNGAFPPRNYSKNQVGGFFKKQFQTLSSGISIRRLGCWFELGISVLRPRIDGVIVSYWFFIWRKVFGRLWSVEYLIRRTKRVPEGSGVFLNTRDLAKTILKQERKLITIVVTRQSKLCNKERISFNCFFF